MIHSAIRDHRFFAHSQCISSAPKVHISPVPEAQCFQTILAGMPLLLECQVSTSDASVQWLKDGDPVLMDENSLIVKSEDCLRRLLINSACPLDSGTYTCCTADETVDFTVTVEGEWRQRDEIMCMNKLIAFDRLLPSEEAASWITAESLLSITNLGPGLSFSLYYWTCVCLFCCSITLTIFLQLSPKYYFCSLTDCIISNAVKHSSESLLLIFT